MTQITDGDLMRCCMIDSSKYDQSPTTHKPEGYYRYEEKSTSNYGTRPNMCYNPEDYENISCDKDLNGNSLYSCFPAMGDEVPNCRPSCISGHPQSNQRPLNEKDFPGVLPIAERGVELYENWGLDDNVRGDSGRYGDDDYIGCIAEYGRRISLYGNISLTITYLLNSENGFNGTNYDPKIILNSSFSTNEPLTAENYNLEQQGGYKVNNFETLYEITFNQNDGASYMYFGNYGIVFHYGKSFNPIPLIFDKKTKKMYYFSGMPVSKNISKTSVSLLSFMIIDSYANPYRKSMNRSLGTQVPNYYIQPKFDNDTSCDSNKMEREMGLFPVSYLDPLMNSDPYKCNSPHNSEGLTSTPFDCYASGVRSLYIPPHMSITKIKYWDYTNFNSNSKRDDSKSSPSVKTVSGVPFYNYNSKYKNGTFHAVGSKTLNSNKQNDYFDKTNYIDTRDAVIPLPAGALYSITVQVRQDDYFVDNYIKPYYNQFAPEILLIPGVENAYNFGSTAKVKNVIGALSGQKTLNPLQFDIRNVNDFWTNKNPYWDGKSYIKLNLDYSPGDVIYRTTDQQPIPDPLSYYKTHGKITVNNGTVTCTPNDTSNQKTAKRKKMLQKPIDVLNAKSKSLLLNTNRVLNKTLNLSSVFPVNPYYRIQGFSVYNGIFSVEWLYVLYNCSMKGLNYVSVDQVNNKYLYGGNLCNQKDKQTCGAECMQYRDPWKYLCQNSSQVSSADIMMQAYCGMRNLSYVYLLWQVGTSFATNQCSCLSTGKGACTLKQPGQACDVAASNNKTYVRSSVNCSCTSVEICSYCETTVFQAVLSFSGGCSYDNTNYIGSLDTCTNTSDCSFTNTTTVPTAPSDNGNSGSNGGSNVDDDDDEFVPPSNDDDDKNKNSSFITFIVIIFLVIILFCIAYAFYRYYKKNYSKK